MSTPGSSVSDGTRGADGSGGLDTTAQGSTSEGPKFDLGEDTGPAEVCGEPEDNPIYVFTRGLETGAATSIRAFDPETLTFTSVVDTVVCPEVGEDWGASSMAVDRERRAWISWSAAHDGIADPAYKRLDRIDLDTGGCEIDVGELPVTDNWGTPLGSAFVTEFEDSGTERLFFVDTGTYLHTLASQASLGRWWELGPEGRTFSGVELTGRGDGRLFSLIMNYTGPFDHPCTAEDPCLPTVRLGEVDKSDASAISMIDLPGIEALGLMAGGFAFAHWGGHFWIFITLEFGPTQVFDYDPQTRTTVLALDDGPPGVVGAGVSTCAPLVFPEG